MRSSAISQTFRKSTVQRLIGAPAEAELYAEAFLMGGVERWESEGRLGTSEAAALRAHLSSSQVQNALRHLGMHMILSAPIPVPGLQNLARLAWTVASWFVAQVRRTTGTAGRIPNIHSPLVMMISLVPGLGTLAYLAARPLRNRLLIRLVLDQVGWKLPFRLYGRMHLGRWLAPAHKSVQSEPRGAAEHHGATIAPAKTLVPHSNSGDVISTWRCDATICLGATRDD